MVLDAKEAQQHFELATRKSLLIIEQFAALGKKINPLVLIQLPNDDQRLHEIGQKKKEEVEETPKRVTRAKKTSP